MPCKQWKRETFGWLTHFPKTAGRNNKTKIEFDVVVNECCQKWRVLLGMCHF
jgi:hypothetical protein